MQQVSGNPAKNALSAGVVEEDIVAAIESSGYPLQLQVASILTNAFSIVEEWSYADRTTNELRTIDLYATRILGNQGPVFPSLTLLVECKRSSLPYVFFRAAVSPHLPGFPAVHALPGETIDTHTPSGILELPPAKILGLADEPFATDGGDVCATFSKCTRKGKDLELSGVEAFNSIVLPLVSALKYDSNHHRVKQAQKAYFPALTLAVCVLQAPMVVTEVMSGYRALHPWVRIVRQEAVAGKPRNQFVIDVVHVDFLSTYIGDHVMPLAETFRQRSAGRFSMLHNMTAHAPSVSDWSWRDIRAPDGT